MTNQNSNNILGSFYGLVDSQNDLYDSEVEESLYEEYDQDADDEEKSEGYPVSANIFGGE